VKRDQAPKTMSMLMIVMLILACCAPVAAGLFRVWVSQDALQKGYALSAATQERRELRESNTRLEVELASARAPERLLEFARKLGLEAAKPEQIIAENPSAWRAKP